MTSGVLAATSSSLSDVEPGVLGFLVVAAIAVALVFLLRSMNKQFRKIGPAPEAPGTPGAPWAPGASAPGSTFASAKDADEPVTGPSTPS